MEWLRKNCFLVGGDNVKRPVYISTIRTSPYEMTSFEGYFSDVFSMYPKSIEKNDPIEKVIFNDPATIVKWSDGTKTVVKCQEGDTYDKEKGLALCIAKKYFGNKGNFNEVFKKWIPEELKEKEIEISVEEMRDKLNKFCTKKCYSDNCPFLKESCGNGSYFEDTDKFSDNKIKKLYKRIFKK